MRIYLDHNSGSTLRPEAIAAFNAVVLEGEGNPAAVHRAGQRARRALEQARNEVADLVAARPSEIIFTSGGTESNNFAIAGVLGTLSTRRKVITSAIEHSSILAPLLKLENRGFEVVRIAPDREGRISPEALAVAIDELSREIPPDLPWILRVDGHTDKHPITGGPFKSNWDLSAARAIAVVQYLISKGVPAERLAAAVAEPAHPILSA